MAKMKFDNSVTPEINSISIPTSSGGSEFGLGTDGQTLKTNGTSIYWGDNSYNDLTDKPTIVTYTAGTNVSISADNKISSSVPSNYLNKSSTSSNILSGNIQVGSASLNVVNAYLHIRNVGDNSITGAKVNGACFSVNGDGTASFQHKKYNDSGGGAKNSAILRFSNLGLQFAVNSGDGSSPTEDMYKQVAMIDDINSAIVSTLNANY